MTTMTTNLFAYTEVGSRDVYPGYISINESAGENIKVTVRSPGSFGTPTATVEMTREQVIEMATNLLAKLNA